MAGDLTWVANSICFCSVGASCHVSGVRPREVWLVAERELGGVVGRKREVVGDAGELEQSANEVEVALVILNDVFELFVVVGRPS